MKKYSWNFLNRYSRSIREETRTATFFPKYGAPFAVLRNSAANLTRRAYGDQDWHTCYERGLRVYRTLAAARGDPHHHDIDPTATAVHAYTRTALENQNAPNLLQLCMTGLNLPVNGLEKVQLTKQNLPHGPHGVLDPNPIFEKFFSAQQGIIIASSNDRDRDNDDLPQNRMNWAEAAWEGYRDLANAQHAPVTNLRYMFRYWIANEQTKNVVFSAYQSMNVRDDPPGRWTMWTYETNDRRKENFLALLGTPNGVGQAKLLTNHAFALGGKNIVEIRTHYQRGGMPHMVFVVASHY